MQKNPSVLPRILGSPGALLTEIFNSVCKKPAVARIKFNEDLGIEFQLFTWLASNCYSSVFSESPKWQLLSHNQSLLLTFSVWN